MTLIAYKDIVDSDDLGLYWKGSEHYPPEQISDARLNLAKNINAFRFLMDGAKEERHRYDEIFKNAYDLLYKIVYSENVPAYLFKIEDDPHIPNRIRSFKGILPKKELDPDSYYEQEIKIPGNDETLILSLVLLTKNNFNKVISSIGNNRKNFIVISSFELIFGAQILQSIANNCLREDFTINYLCLLELFYDGLGAVCRLSGDGGDTSLNIDIFYKEEDLHFTRLIQAVAVENPTPLS